MESETDNCSFCNKKDLDYFEECEHCGKIACIVCCDEKIYESGRLGLYRLCVGCFKEQFPEQYKAYQNM